MYLNTILMSLNDRTEYVELPQTSYVPMLEDANAYLKVVGEFLQPTKAVV